MNDIKKTKIKLLGLGLIFGWFSSHLLYTQIGHDAFWTFDTIGVLVFVIGFLYYSDKADKKPAPDQVANDKKTLKNKLTIWRQ